MLIKRFSTTYSCKFIFLFHTRLIWCWWSDKVSSCDRLMWHLCRTVIRITDAMTQTLSRHYSVPRLHPVTILLYPKQMIPCKLEWDGDHIQRKAQRCPKLRYREPIFLMQPCTPLIGVQQDFKKSNFQLISQCIASRVHSLNKHSPW